VSNTHEMSVPMRETKSVLPSLPAGLEYLAPTGPTHASVAVFGNSGTGKTRLGATMPGPLGLLPTHAKARTTTIEVASALGKRIVVPSADETFERVNPMWFALSQPVCDKIDGDWRKAHKYKVDIDKEQPKCCSLHYSRWLVDRFKRRALQMAEAPDSLVRSIVVDSATHLFDSIMYANYGRDDKIYPLDRQWAMKEMSDFLTALEGKNLLITHERSSIYEEYGQPGQDGASPGQRPRRDTGLFKPKGWKGIGYFASIVLETIHDPAAMNGGDSLGFFVNVKQCIGNVSLLGRQRVLADENINFANVMALVYPDAADAWMD
jgi:hypothetical protein